MVKDEILLYTITFSIVGTFIVFLLYSLYMCVNILSKSKKIKKNNKKYK